MRSRNPMLILAGFILSTAPAAADTVAPQNSSIVANYERATGIVRPAAPLLSTGAASTVVTSGTLVINFTVSIVSAIPTSVPILCQGTAQVQYGIESKTVAATRTSAGAARCSVSVPYVFAIPSTGVPLTLGASYGVSYAQGLLAGVVSDTFLTEALPANGTTTTYNATVKL